MKYLRTMALCLLPVTALAEQSTGCELQFFPVTPQPVWVENFDLCNDDIRRFFEARALGFEFYRPALERFSNLDPAKQAQVLEATHLGTTVDGLEPDLRVPETLIKAILSEAAENGADEFFEIPGYEGILGELRDYGATESGDTFNRLKEHAPIHVDMLFFVNAVRRAVERKDESASRLAESASRLAESAETRGILQDAVNAANGN